MKGQLTTITPQDVPSYNLYYLQKEIMLNEKLEALLTRHKSRDIFDLYFILRKEELRQALKINNEHRIKILSLLDKQDRKKIASDLKSLLPKSFWPIVIDLPAQLRRLL